MNNIKRMNFIASPESECKFTSAVSDSSFRRSKAEQHVPKALFLSMKRGVIFLLSVASLTLVTQLASAQVEHVTNADPYSLRANAIRSEFIPDTVASEHKISAGPDRGLLNVVILRSVPDGEDATVQAEVIAYQRNLIGQRKTIEMRSVRVNDRITYLGDFDSDTSSNSIFVIEATPQGSEETMTLEFEDQL